MHTELIEKLKTFYNDNRQQLMDAEIDGYILDALSDAQFAQRNHEDDLIDQGIIKPFCPHAEWGTMSKAVQGVK